MYAKLMSKELKQLTNICHYEEERRGNLYKLNRLPQQIIIIIIIIICFATT